jgi:hypothetical protein
MTNPESINYQKAGCQKPAFFILWFLVTIDTAYCSKSAMAIGFRYEKLTELFPDLSITWFYKEPEIGKGGSSSSNRRITLHKSFPMSGRMSIFLINPCLCFVSTCVVFHEIAQNKHQFLAEKPIFKKNF